MRILLISPEMCTISIYYNQQFIIINNVQKIERRIDHDVTYQYFYHLQFTQSILKILWRS